MSFERGALIQPVTGRRNCKCKLILHHLEQEAKDYCGCQVPKRIGVCFKEYKAHSVLGQKASNQCVRLKIQERGDKTQKREKGVGSKFQMEGFVLERKEDTFN